MTATATLAASAEPAAAVPSGVLSTTSSIDRQSPKVVRAAKVALSRHRSDVRSGTVTSAQSYRRARNRTARLTAAALGLDPVRMVRRWRRVDRRHQVAVLAALTQLGTQYRRYGSTPKTGFDCSGLTSWAWRRAGVEIPRSSGDQIAAAAPRRRRTAHPGDLVYYPGHVSLYLGVAGAIVHASDPEDDVELAFSRRDVRWGHPRP